MRAPLTKRGKYDDLIDWIKLLEQKLSLWLESRKAIGMFVVLAQQDSYSLVAEPVSAIGWEAQKERAKQRTMHWIHIHEACMDLQHEMEGWTRVQPDHLREHIEKVHAALLWFEKNNTEQDLGIKY